MKKIKCARQYTVDLINIKISRNVQTGYYIIRYITVFAIRMVENNE